MNKFKQQKWSMDMLPKDILIEKIKRLEQTLKEIKEIVIDTGNQRPPFDWSKTSDNLKQILQKISEVIDD